MILISYTIPTTSLPVTDALSRILRIGVDDHHTSRVKHRVSREERLRGATEAEKRR
jgi:hypothetical protein